MRVKVDDAFFALLFDIIAGCTTTHTDEKMPRKLNYSAKIKNLALIKNPET